MHEVLPPVLATWDPLTATDPRTPQKRTSMADSLCARTLVSWRTRGRANTRPRSTARGIRGPHVPLPHGGSARPKADRAAMLHFSRSETPARAPGPPIGEGAGPQGL